MVFLLLWYKSTSKFINNQIKCKFFYLSYVDVSKNKGLYGTMYNIIDKTYS